ncbi:hypothetical protein CC86DRAFT_403913 [Ophiobolus disseminans]|uniref:G protein-coupled glucose receptor regulating Gpa2-domain-containing protein n=1 Tax=Ophiobolus disseminans TaxID=1469910 RepID=A0A6A7A980_9PLEO|nr:hypothetical protein CC86DRAFT_403913 [Ophiobolus disseminans]
MHHSALAMLGPDSAYTSAEARDLQRTYQVRLVALSCSGASVMASVVAFYWFCRMEKLFRHRLIMLLVYGDLTRSVWYFVFAVFSLARGTVKTETNFCQASGFFIQYGAETSDYAVLVMAVHSALQVFRPATRGTSDGLYKYRYYLYFGGLVLPGTMASLAFINPESAYLSQGAFCTLPIRPFWYRLALAWIPRYLIAAIIVSLAIAIYAYVGFEFRSYAKFSRSLQTSTTNTTRGDSHVDRDAEAAVDHSNSAGEDHESCGRRASSIAHDVVASQRRGSAVVFATERHTINGATTGLTQSLPSSPKQLPLQRTPSVRPPLFAIPSGQTIKPESIPSPFGEPRGGPLSPALHQPSDSLSTETTQTHVIRNDPPSARETSPTPPATRHLHRQRMRIHRQLRLMFIYPLVYTLMWLIPFIQHCMMYSDRFAHHPIWFFRIGTTICITSMGFVDCLIFSLREKPWRTIQTSDGTIWGSLAVWRSPQLSNAGISMSVNGGISGGRVVLGSTDDGETRIARMRSSIRTSASDDFTRLAAEQARVRLDLEREERLARMKERVEKRKASVGCGSEEYVSGESRYSGDGDEGVDSGKGKEKEKDWEADMVDRVDWEKEGN